MLATVQRRSISVPNVLLTQAWSPSSPFKLVNTPHTCTICYFPALGGIISLYAVMQWRTNMYLDREFADSRDVVADDFPELPTGELLVDLWCGGCGLLKLVRLFKEHNFTTAVLVYVREQVNRRVWVKALWEWRGVCVHEGCPQMQTIWQPSLCHRRGVSLSQLNTQTHLPACDYSRVVYLDISLAILRYFLLLVDTPLEYLYIHIPSLSNHDTTYGNNYLFHHIVKSIYDL